ncbi:MAG: hypothetical protein KF696_10990 [Planctomycetes bacterium]|nr:hypothetical protein [Planctomycetota bacterium]MCW8135823.1 hypothetical protein [Planctomycetota bacterium]
MARRSSSESARHTPDYSMVAVAAMALVFVYALSQHVIPNYHELQAMERHHKALKRHVAEQREANAVLQDQIEALDDPYYLAEHMIAHYGWRRAPQQLEHAPGG